MFDKNPQQIKFCNGTAAIEMILIMPFLLFFILAIIAITQLMQINMTVNSETRTAAWRSAQFQNKCSSAVSSKVSNNLNRLRVTTPLTIDCFEINKNESQHIPGSAAQILQDMETAGEKKALQTIRNDGISPDKRGYVRGFGKIIENSGLPQATIAYGTATYSSISTKTFYTQGADWGDFIVNSQFAVEADTKTVWSVDASHLSKGHNVEFSKRMDAPKSILFPQFFP